MQNEINILSKTINGIISKEKNAQTYRVLFKNLNFSFTQEGFDLFSKYIIELKSAFNNQCISSTCSCSRISIPTGNKTLELLLSYAEIDELHDLISLKTSRINLIFKMNYTFSLN